MDRLQTALKNIETVIDNVPLTRSQRLQLEDDLKVLAEAVKKIEECQP